MGSKQNQPWNQIYVRSSSSIGRQYLLSNTKDESAKGASNEASVCHLIGCLIVHHQTVIHEIKTIGLSFEGVGNHVLN